MAERIKTTVDELSKLKKAMADAQLDAGDAVEVWAELQKGRTAKFAALTAFGTVLVAVAGLALASFETWQAHNKQTELSLREARLDERQADLDKNQKQLDESGWRGSQNSWLSWCGDAAFIPVDGFGDEWQRFKKCLPQSPSCAQRIDCRKRHLPNAPQ